MDERIVGIILAGGKSRRFGEPKAFAKKDGKAFYQYSVDALTPVVETITMVTSPELKHRFPNEGKMTIVEDKKEYQGEGPLAGMLTAMEKTPGQWYIVIPIDVPFMDHSIIRKLVDHIEKDVDAIIPVVAGKLQPLIAIYHYSVKGRVLHQLDNNQRSLRSFLDNCHVKYVEIEEEMPFMNINRQADYQKWVEENEDI